MSYRRTQAEHVSTLQRCLRDVGVPTWRDVDDLPLQPTEEALRTTLTSPEISGAILWISSDVVDSPVIRNVEAPLIIDRARKDPGFFALPVGVGGLSYEQAAEIANIHLAARLNSWNMKLVANPALNEDVRAVADAVLTQRLERLKEQKDRIPQITLLTRGEGVDKPGTLVVDWRHRFRGFENADWQGPCEISQISSQVAENVKKYFSDRPINISGSAHLSAAFALGRGFKSVLGIDCSWNQVMPSGSHESWSLNTREAECGLEEFELELDPGGCDVAILVSISRKTEPAFTNHINSTGKKYRAVVEFGFGDRQPHALTVQEANFVAHRIVDSVKQSADRYKADGIIHLFISAPAGLAFMLGQLSNSLGPIQTYEYLPNANVGQYVKSARV